jgi:DtxR family Mn-dependent transcriptional regulator
VVEQQLPEGIQSVTALRHGDRATVVCMGGSNPSRHNTLAVFGLTPGAEIMLVQQQPSCVVRVGETELALDAEIARDILVQQAPQQEPAGV